MIESEHQSRLNVCVAFALGYDFNFIFFFLDIYMIIRIVHGPVPPLPSIV